MRFEHFSERRRNHGSGVLGVVAVILVHMSGHLVPLRSYLFRGSWAWHYYTRILPIPLVRPLLGIYLWEVIGSILKRSFRHLVVVSLHVRTHSVFKCAVREGFSTQYLPLVRRTWHGQLKATILLCPSPLLIRCQYACRDCHADTNPSDRAQK